MQERWLRNIAATLFSLLFLTISLTLVGLSVMHFIQAFSSDEFISGIIKAINDLFIALATYELAVGIFKEYRQENEINLYSSIRRTITRFVSVAVIALVLEGLIMIIKYSQLELAGNLFYPVGVIFAAGILLIALGIFLKLTLQSEIHPAPKKSSGA